MNVGIIGSGGREHAICYMLNKSKKVSGIFCFPGNAGTSLIAQNVNLDPDNFSELERYCLKKDIKIQEFYLKTNQPKSCSGAYLEVVDDGSRTNFKICENSPGITLSNSSMFGTTGILETRYHH
mgnify:CR=1 FL=1